MPSPLAPVDGAVGVARSRRPGSEGAPAFGALAWAAVAGVLVGYLVAALYAAPATVDDAFIALRYARNLVAGRGLVWNPGERVEGFSDPLWVALLAGLEALRLPALAAGKAIGALASVGALLTLRTLAHRRLGVRPSLVVLALAVVASDAGFVYHGVAGLETPLFTLLVTLAVERALAARLGTSALLLAALVWCRPEGVAYLAVLGLGGLEQGVPRRRLAALLAIPLGAALGLVLARHAYYGTFLPQTFHAKVGVDPIVGAAGTVAARDPLTALLRWGPVAYAAEFARHGLALVLAPLALIGAVILARRGPRAPLGALGAAALFVLVAGGDWMPWSRFLLPVLPITVAMAVLAIEAATRRAAERRALGDAPRWLPAIGPLRLGQGLLLLAIGLHLVEGARGLAGLRRDDVYNPAVHSRRHLEVAAALAQLAAPGDAVVVNEIGAIGLVTGLRVIDSLGLTEPAVPPLLREAGRDPRALDRYADSLLRDHPRFVLVNDRQAPGEVAPHPTHAALLAAMERSGEYRHARDFALSPWKHLLLFVRTTPEPPHR